MQHRPFAAIITYSQRLHEKYTKSNNFSNKFVTLTGTLMSQTWFPSFWFAPKPDTSSCVLGHLRLWEGILEHILSPPFSLLVDCVAGSSGSRPTISFLAEKWLKMTFFLAIGHGRSDYYKN